MTTRNWWNKTVAIGAASSALVLLSGPGATGVTGRPTRVGAGKAGLGVTSPTSDVAVPVSAEQAVAFLNAQRLANGIPGDLGVSATMTDGCAKHNNYIAVNGGVLTHSEDPAKPGYTPEGAKQTPGSGGSEVLSSGRRLWDSAWANPWATAPIHLMLMFRPTVTTAGYAEGPGSSCMRFTGFRDLPAGVNSLPGDGASGVPTDMNSSGEGPYSPNDVVGIPEEQAGYNILLWRTIRPEHSTQT